MSVRQVTGSKSSPASHAGGRDTRSPIVTGPRRTESGWKTRPGPAAICSRFWWTGSPCRAALYRCATTGASMTSGSPWVTGRGEPWPTNAQTTEERGRLPKNEDLERLQWTTILYYLHETNPDNGLVRDKTDPAAPCSIAAVGMSLATLPVAVERGVFFRPFAAKMARRKLLYLHDLPQGPEPDDSGYKGFFYHFLDIETGRRVWQCELSTIDSAFLFAGMLTAAAYFDQDTADEAEVRRLADALYRRADWDWARDGGATLTHGWRPESGFLPYRWEGYDEGLLLYVLGLGSPTHPLPPGELRRILRDVPVEAALRPRAALLRATVHPPALSPVDRLPRHPRRLHARPRQRLLREQPAGDLSCSKRTRSTTRCNSPATGSIAGGLRPATAPVG